MGKYSAAAHRARNMANKQLKTEVAILMPFDRDRIQKLLPTKKDEQNFLDLMAEVEKETEMDIKLGYLTDNLQTAGKVVFKVLKAFI